MDGIMGDPQRIEIRAMTVYAPPATMTSVPLLSLK